MSAASAAARPCSIRRGCRTISEAWHSACGRSPTRSLGIFDKALSDYDAALKIKPDFPLALNNRAWAYYKLGRPSDGVADVERALELSPGSPYALDTRAHIRQAQGDAKAALADYDLAMRVGGERIVRMYQCGLRSQGLYFGALDGVYSSAVGQRHARVHRQSPMRPAALRCGVPARGFLSFKAPLIRIAQIAAVHQKLAVRNNLTHPPRSTMLRGRQFVGPLSRPGKSNKVQV